MQDKMKKLDFRSIQDLTLNNYFNYIFYSSDSNKTFGFQETPLLINTDSIVSYEFKTDDKTVYKIKIAIKKFDSLNHVIGKTQGLLVEIDNEPIFGVDGVIPYREFKNIEVFKNNELIGINKSEYRDLYNPKVGCIKRSKFSDYIYTWYTKVFYQPENDYLIIELHGSDGGGAYYVFWIFKNGNYLKRVVIMP
ncbi:MAG: hypothetical protein DRJ05_10395 [Bacteroidetes bacterium]|nr:MAG: hypothetical protein DRJ05_10395 [Bacteroidota bacterium]